VALQADGSAMYTVQALWTMAREGLDVTVVLFSNRKYAILQVEFMRVGAHNPGPKAMDMLDLTRPDLDWVSIARVDAVRADDAASFNQALGRSFATPGPFLIEAVI
jgi:acetolactate synthase-1/2/3 large subunit